MGKNAINVEEIEVASVRRNKILAMAADRTTVEQCKKAMDKYGALTLPVVGMLRDGSRVILSGECEFAAIKENGVQRMAAAMAEVPEDDAGGAKLSLLLSSIKKGPGALCEGMLLRDALESGATRLEIGKMLGRSSSWLSNRLALATRLDGGVREMLSSGLLDARSAQEIARLPNEMQYSLAKIIVQEGLPKSAVDKLVAGYNADGCPDEVKEQIKNNPRMALARITDGRRAVELPEPQKGPEGIPACLEAVKKPHAWLARALNKSSPEDAAVYKKALDNLEADILALLTMIRRLVSPGKYEEAPYAN